MGNAATVPTAEPGARGTGRRQLRDERGTRVAAARSSSAVTG